MENITSYGIVPCYKVEDAWHYLLVHHQAGHWSFPKGQIKAGEMPQHCAEREFREETGISTCNIIRPNYTQDLDYEVEVDGELVHKTVTFYLGVISGTVPLSDTSISDIKITAYRILPYYEAVDLLTYENTRQVLRWAEKIGKD